MKYIAVLLFLLVCATVQAGDARVTSGVYAWEDPGVSREGPGQQRLILEGSTPGFEYFRVQANSLEPGGGLPDGQIHDDVEELLIIKEGTLEVTINGEGEILPAGSVSLILPGDSHAIRNIGAEPASYYVLRWRTAAHGDAQNPSAVSTSVNWDKLELKQIAKGGRRHILQVPTTMLAGFEMHTTTLKQGWKSHDQHVHDEDEIILVRFGQFEQLIDSVAHHAGPGAVIFLQSDQPHGIRNIGEGPCEYYAFKWRLR